ncbi:MAG TPA: hypothetical protein P5137_14580, partial [Candidatus Brocadiia bacterium]|nr:hypothetical protein [Candidatus Brocadiia bacterium]
MSHFCAIRTAACLMAAVLLGAPAQSQPEEPPAPRRLVLPRLLTPPRIDGRLDDPCWLAATPTEQFLDPAGQPGSPHTIARAGFTGDALLIGFVCLQTHDEETLEIELYPLGPLPTPTPAEGAAAGEEATLEEPAPTVGQTHARRIRISLPINAAPTATGANVKVQAAFQRLKGGYTAEIAVPMQDISTKGFTPIAGDLWLANLRRRTAQTSLAWSVGAEPTSTQNDEEKAFHNAGEWTFEAPNLIANGGAEDWENVTPKGWLIEVPGVGRAPASRDEDSAIEGQT